MLGRSIFRPFLLRRAFGIRSISSQSTLSVMTMSAPKSNLPISTLPSISAAQNLHFSNCFLPFPRSFCSSPTDPSNVVLINSEVEFNSALTKVVGDSLPAIFYFTAAWCGPCRFMSPSIEELSKRFPHVSTYKIDIDQEDLARTLEMLNVTSVPTVHFFQNGKKEAEIVGADIAHLYNIVEKLKKV